MSVSLNHSFVNGVQAKVDLIGEAATVVWHDYFPRSGIINLIARLFAPSVTLISTTKCLDYESGTLSRVYIKTLVRDM